MEAVAEACASTAVILASSNLASKILADHASAEQKARWLRPYAEGTPGPRELRAERARLRLRRGRAHDRRRAPTATSWVLAGQKMWITSGAHAGIHIVFARTGGAGPDGISCFVVEKRHAGAPRRQGGGQDGPACVGHGRALVRRLSRAGVAPRRAPRRRLRDRALGARRRTRRHRRRSRWASPRPRSRPAPRYARERRAFGKALDRLPEHAVRARRLRGWSSTRRGC